MNASCKNANLIDKYEVNLDSLLTLPDNFYAYRGGEMYLEDLKAENYRVWFNLSNGKAQDISKIEYFRNKKNNLKDSITAYKLDTSLCKIYAQRFIELSRQYKFGHIGIGKQNEVSLSYNEDVSEQYVRPLNDSIKQMYAHKKDFRLLPNGWFEKIEQ